MSVWPAMMDYLFNFYTSQYGKRFQNVYELPDCGHHHVPERSMYKGR